MEEEVREGTQSEESEDQPTTKLPSDEYEIELSDGERITYGELKQSHLQAAEQRKDYTLKTQEAAEMKRNADSAMAEADAIKAEAVGNLTLANNLRTAMATDLVFYNTHERTEWAGYKQEVEKVMDGANGNPTVTPNAPPAANPVKEKELEELRTRVASLEGTNTMTENEKKVDVALGIVSDIAGTEGLELVTHKMLVKAVQAHQAESRGELPSRQQIIAAGKELQESLIEAGIPVPRGMVGPGGSTKPRVTGEVAATVEPKWKTLNLKKDRKKVEEALAAVLREKQRAKG